MTLSGWCMIRDPAQHELCPLHFTGWDCSCKKCEHPGAKTADRLKSTAPDPAKPAKTARRQKKTEELEG